VVRLNTHGAGASRMETRVQTEPHHSHGGAPSAIATAGSGSRRKSPRYAALFADSVVPRQGYTRVVRPGTQIVIVTARHDALSADELRAIGEYRLDQYILAGLYDAEVADRLGLTTDPEMGRLSPRGLHIAIGDTSGRFLCYVCFESASIPPFGNVRSDLVYPVLRDTDRLYFPCEVDFGGWIYADHPGMALLPAANVRELIRLVRNQSEKSPLDRLAVVEMLVAIARVLSDPVHRLEAIVGCASPDVRRLLHSYGIPVAYMPFATDKQGWYSAQTDAIWTEASHRPGRFWPFAIATADIRAETPFFDALEEALSLDPPYIAEALAPLRRRGPERTPRYIHGDPDGPADFWTADASYRADNHSGAS
jgi:hypothetical protein